MKSGAYIKHCNKPPNLQGYGIPKHLWAISYYLKLKSYPEAENEVQKIRYCIAQFKKIKLLNKIIIVIISTVLLWYSGNFTVKDKILMDIFPDGLHKIINILQWWIF